MSGLGPKQSLTAFGSETKRLWVKDESHKLHQGFYVQTKVSAGQPVMLHTNGKIKPWDGTSEHTCIGVSLHTIDPTDTAQANKRCTVKTRGFVIIEAIADGAMTTGPVKYTGVDANGMAKYSSAAVTITNCVGWSLEAVADTARFKIMVKN